MMIGARRRFRINLLSWYIYIIGACSRLWAWPPAAGHQPYSTRLEHV
jgi:hypothetical protein